MSYGIRKDFYNSKVWKRVRKNIWLKQNCLCARCKLPCYVDGISDYLPKEERRNLFLCVRSYIIETTYEPHGIC